MLRNIVYCQNRIDMLEGRVGKENKNIIRKLKRKIYNLQKTETK